jgi:Root hair defective 3 GTP-binding protein (RHD3).
MWLASSSHIVSGSNSRLPMSLSSVINDLEAEGASRVTTFAFLTSRGITQAQRSELLSSLFGIRGDGDHDKEVVDGVTTAFGKKMGEEHDTDEEEEEEEDDEEGRELATPSIGIAVANPLPNAAVNEVAATVQACGGNIVFVASLQDLERGEGLFDKLAPAMERILNRDEKSQEDGSVSEGRKTLVVVVGGATTQQDLLDAKAKLESVAASVLSNIVQPDPNRRATTLQLVFDSVEYVASSGPVDELLEDIGFACDPATAASNVAKSVYQDANTQTTVAGLHGSPLDLAAARKLLPLSRKVKESCLSVVRQNCSNEQGEMMLVKDFGSLCDAAVKSTMQQFDQEAGPKLVEKSSVGKRIRRELVEDMYSDLESMYEEQLKLLHTAAFESFRANLSRLRISPNLASDMEKVAAEAVKLFSDTAKSLAAKKVRSVVWPKPDSHASKLKRELKEYVALRLQTARADGKFRPVPRKGVTMGLHWLLPKPFGNDYRLEPWEVHAKDDLIYVPKDKITDVRKEDVKTGDWRDAIVPCPTANEMMYLK